MIRPCLLAVGVLCVVAAGVPADERDELKAVAGVWVVEKAALNGADATAGLKAYTLTLDGDTYTLADNGTRDKGTIKVDGTKSPKTMDITGGEGSPFKGKTFPCIYEVKDGKLTICYGMDFQTRPTEFTADKDSKRMLAVYVRADAQAPTGEWVVESAEMAGQSLTEHLKGMKYSAADGKYTARLGERTETGAYKFDPKKSPKELDISPADGPHKGKTMPAIYEVTGETMRVCYDQDGKDRPTKFKTSPDRPKTILLVFKRAGKSSG
jgi:uncharacterized protein (TIGR03067 family)